MVIEFNVDADFRRDLVSDDVKRVPASTSRSYTVFISGDVKDIEDFEICMKGVCMEYNAHVFERVLNKLN